MLFASKRHLLSLAFYPLIATCVSAFLPSVPSFVLPSITNQIKPTHMVLRSRSYDYSKWDDLDDNDDGEVFQSDDGTSAKHVSADMKYALPNIKRQSENYDAILNMGGPDLSFDVWLQPPGDSVAWFVGRIASVSDVSAERAIDRQFPLIERHAWMIRPVDLHPSRGPFLVYFAPGGTEERVGGGDASIPLVRVEEEALTVGKGTVRTVEVGFRGAAYDDADGADAYRVELVVAEDLDIEKTNVENAAGEFNIDYEEFDFAPPATKEEDAEMQQLADKLRTKDPDKLFDDDDWKDFVDRA